MQTLLTIVVPVYKVEKYINKCLDSCILYNSDGSLDEEKTNQLEVIIINDGTPDQSAELSRQYVLRHPKIFRQIDKKNGGHGSAWNVGLKEATGKYIRFLDSDDWLLNLSKLLDNLNDCDADVVFTDYIRVNEQTGDEDYRSIHSQSGETLTLSKEMLLNQDESFFILNFWHTTYKTSILQPQWPLFEEHVMYDDSILGLAPLLYGRTYLYLNFPLYHYLVGRTGQTMDVKVIARNINSYVHCYDRQLNWMKSPLVKSMPLDLQECTQYAVRRYAQMVFCNLPRLPYKDAKRLMPNYYDYGFRSNNDFRGKIVRRYEKLPFPLFYIIEHFRFIYRNISNQS